MIAKLNITISKVLNYEQFKYGIGTIIRLFRLLPLKQGRSPLQEPVPLRRILELTRVVQRALGEI